MSLPRSPRRVHWAAILAACGLANLLGPALGGGDALRAATLAQADTGLRYRLTDTWSGLPWRPEPGRFGAVADISSPPAGPGDRVYVLDGRQRAIHVLDASSRPLARFELPMFDPAEEPWALQALDVGFDGTLYVLGASLVQAPDRRSYRSRVDRLAPDGRLLQRLELQSPVPYAFRDLALGPDGRLYLSRAYPGGPVGSPGLPQPTPDPLRPLRAVDVFDAAGRLQASLAPPALVFPDSLDVAADGTLYVVNRIPAEFGAPPPGATALPRPSRAGAGQAGPGPDRGGQGSGPGRAGKGRGPGPASEAQEPIEGVLVFAPDGRFREAIPFIDAEDIAAGPAGVFLARNVDIFALREGRPVYSGPIAYTGALSGPILHLDAPADGRLLAGFAHCYTQGVLWIDRPAERPATARLSGALDQPELEGPLFPLRLAAGEGLAVLQGRFETDRLGSRPEALVRPFARELQTVQRWSLAAAPGDAGGAERLQSQLGLCSGLDGWWGQDLAVDGSDVYTVDPGAIQRRPDDRLPAWSVAPLALYPEPDTPSRLAAVAADAGKVAALDLGAGRVLLLDRAGGLLDAWAWGDGAVVDLALDARRGRVYLADSGRGRILVRGLDGADLGDWPAHEGPRAIALGPEGDVFLLGRGGWAQRYQPDGRLLAAWPMPERDLEATDLAVDAEGRVYLSFLGRTPPPPLAAEYRIRRAGIWVFEVEEAAPPPREPGACLAWPDKQAAPGRLPLGASVEVRLSVEGRCPGRGAPTQVAIVFDRSRSMAAGVGVSSAIERAREAAMALLGAWSPGMVEAALVTFGEGASLDTPLTADLGHLRQRIAAIEPAGDTQLAAGLALAQAELSGPRAKPGRRLVLVISDGAFKDDPAPAAAALAGAGVHLHAWLFGNAELTNPHRLAWEGMVPRPEALAYDPDAARALALADRLADYRPETGLFERIVVEDRIPPNMRYLPGSAEPPADYDPVGHRLSWNLAELGATDGLRLRYRLVPLEPGRWPTNLEAWADYRDATGAEGRLRFPVPQVEVFALPHRAYLPLAAAGACLSPARPLDIALVLDTSSSMGEADAGAGLSRLAAARAAALAFAAQLDPVADRIALVTFDGEGRRVLDLTADRARLAAALAGLGTAPGTRIDLGLREAADLLESGRRPGAQAAVLLLTDGRQSTEAAPESAVLEAAERLRASGSLVYAIGLGDALDRALLTAVATRPDRYFASPGAAELAGIYRRISMRLVCGEEGGS